ncbi:MAG: hypothetical protein A3F40_00110 [Chlamydiae bacterium RIFCSPHIGHO2_12_FULL_27_8]|nr:MAG: hypothetical protein A3F40_00110 [Chlamydiae bacterium RIFCSPHIGHO2_12_FULL_27_8]
MSALTINVENNNYSTFGSFNHAQAADICAKIEHLLAQLEKTFVFNKDFDSTVFYQDHFIGPALKEEQKSDFVQKSQSFLETMLKIDHLLTKINEKYVNLSRSISLDIYSRLEQITIRSAHQNQIRKRITFEFTRLERNFVPTKAAQTKLYYTNKIKNFALYLFAKIKYISKTSFNRLNEKAGYKAHITVIPLVFAAKTLHIPVSYSLIFNYSFWIYYNYLKTHNLFQDALK